MNSLNDESLQLKLKQLEFLKILTTKIDKSIKDNIRYINLETGISLIVNQYKMDEFNLLP